MQKMLFLFLNNTDIEFINKKLILRFYTTIETLQTI